MRLAELQQALRRTHGCCSIMENVPGSPLLWELDPRLESGATSDAQTGARSIITGLARSPGGSRRCWTVMQSGEEVSSRSLRLRRPGRPASPWLRLALSWRYVLQRSLAACALSYSEEVVWSQLPMSVMPCANDGRNKGGGMIDPSACRAGAHPCVHGRLFRHDALRACQRASAGNA